MTVKHLVTFSDESMSRAADLCEISARKFGVQRAWHWTKRALWNSPFYHAHSAILDAPRGVGYWLWKPYLIKIALDSSVDGDIYVYSDAGIEFIDNVSHIIERMDQDIFLFGNNWEHAHWCKSDVIHMVWPGFIHNVDWSRFGKQVQASVIFFRVSDYTRKFVKEWLDWCLFEGGRLIDDSPSRLPNHPEFREHRHDQSILTTLSYREGLRLHWWPAVYNRFVPGGPVFTYEKGEYQDDYPPLFHHHRLRNDQWPQHMLTEPTEANRDIASHCTIYRS